MKFTRSLLLIALVVTFASSCALTDYQGWTNHKSQGWAKLWGSEGAFSGFGTNDGTYSGTASYDSSKPGYSSRADTLYNPVFAAFSRDGIVDRDAEDTKGKPGSLTANPATPAGKFGEGFVAVDNTPGAPCEFFANITQNHTGGPAGVAVCVTTNEEVDTDFMASFSSMGDMLERIWDGRTTGAFTVEITGVTANGVSVSFSQPASLGLTAVSTRPGRFTLVNSAGVRELANALVANTTDGAAADVSFTIAGGGVIRPPAGVQLAFNHSALLSY